MFLLKKRLPFLLGIILVIVTLVLAGMLANASGLRSQSATTPVFADVPADAWYHGYVKSLAAQGVFEGTECEEGFCPGQPLLRREMAVWLTRALEGSDEATDHDSRFTDVEDDDWQTPYIERMADLGITTGCRSDPPQFCPDSPVNRGQMASFLTRALDLPPAVPAGFTDVAPENAHVDTINRLYAARVTTGCQPEPLRFCPSQSVTRAQMAAFIYRALEWRAEEEIPRVVEDENPGVFLTEENRVSRFVKYEIVDKYADEYPWLMEVWNYTNRPDFTYGTLGQRAGSGGAFDQILYSEPLSQVTMTSLVVGEETFENEASWSVFIHEMAHIYTWATDGANDYPGSTAIAFLYFERLGRTAGCIHRAGSELYADAVTKFVDLPTNSPEWVNYTYWNRCQDLPTEPTEEAVEVVQSAFSGEMPQWFYDTFQLPDGKLDYASLWDEVKAAHGSSAKRSIIYQLKDEFGGYCPDVVASSVRASKLEQPWRDGGCPPPFNEPMPPKPG